MRFCITQHHYSYGIDLHARSVSLGNLDRAGLLPHLRRESRESSRASATSKRQRTRDRAAGKHERTRYDGEPPGSLRRGDRGIELGAGDIGRHAAEVDEEPNRDPRHDDGRQSGTHSSRTGARNGAANEICRDAASDEWRDPEADEEQKAREAIRHR